MGLFETPGSRHKVHLTQRELKSQEAFHVHSTCTCFWVKGNYFQTRISCSLKYRWENKYFHVKRNSFAMALLTINNISTSIVRFSLPTPVGWVIETTSPEISSIPKSFDHLHHKWRTLPMGYTLIYAKEIEWNILPTMVNHECLPIYSNTLQLCQCLELAFDHNWFKKH